MGKTKQFKHTSRYYKLINYKLKCQKHSQNSNKDANTQLQVENISQLSDDMAKQGAQDETTPSNILFENLSHNEHNPRNPFFEEDDDLLVDDTLEDEEDTLLEQTCNFRDELRGWALNYRISHSALTNLLNILRNNGFQNLPVDSRTLLKTPQNINVIRSGGGEYWYYGLENCIRDVLSSKISKPIEPIIITINIDGLPINKSSKHEFWPILCKIETGNITVEPQIVSIFSGIGKPHLNEFLDPFVNETNKLLKEGISFGSFQTDIQIRGFVCDTPARCFIKNISYFNSYHGCSKCLVMGEFDRLGRHMFFPRTDCGLRTNESFRNKTDPDHHKGETPLEKLPVDMVADFPVADSLHLFDLGIMKRCLLAWMSGSFGFRAKWSANNINQISELLEDYNHQVPLEIHRAVRSLDCIKFWKGLEFRTFLLYLGPVVLKDYLETEFYAHYLILFCAVTLCSTEVYLPACDVAKTLFLKYVKDFGNLYGQDCISSNVHSLCHVVDDVKKFGCLPSFSAYPFESKLYQLKCLIRSGNRPLAQVAKRIYEIFSYNKTTTLLAEPLQYPYVKNIIKNQDDTLSFKKIYVKKEFVLTMERNQDKWFLTHNEEIVCMTSAILLEENIQIQGQVIQCKKSFFDRPFDSAHLHVYTTDGNLSSEKKLYNLKDIQCKLIRLKYRNTFVFLPLLHTLEQRDQV